MVSNASCSCCDLPTFSLMSKDSPPDERRERNWRSVPLKEVTPGRRRNVSRLRSVGGDPTCVPPDFNNSMLAVWEELWHTMPQSGRVGVTVTTLLQRYKERCRAERKRMQDTAETPPALLPVSFARAKNWLLRQQQAQSQALQIGAVNEEAREVVAELSLCLAEQPASTATLLEQPARPASPVIAQPVLSLGPEPVTDQARAEERAEGKHRKKVGEIAGPSKKKATPNKKKKDIPPELQERQERASARMLELGVPPLQDSSDGKRRCPVCDQFRTVSDKTPEGLIHRVLGRSNKIWCPYADDRSILEAFEKEQKERMQAAWRKAGEAKRLKKAQHPPATS